MTITDPIADMLTRIRNALKENQSEVSIPFSKIKYEICKRRILNFRILLLHKSLNVLI